MVRALMLLKQVDVMGARIVNELSKITASAEALFIIVATTCDVKQLVDDRAQVPHGLHVGHSINGLRA